MPNMSLKKNPMPEQAPDVRNKNFEEVVKTMYRASCGAYLCR